MPGFSVNIGADIKPLTTGLNQATAEVQKFSSAVTAAPVQALNTLNNAVQSTVVQFDELAASKAAMDRITASIDAAADAALNAVPKFDSIALSLPITDFRKFTDETEKLRQSLARGLKFQVGTPNTPVIPPIPPVPASVINSLKQTTTAASAANGAVLDFSRVIQDLPFGMVGIVNNLQQLPGGLQRLSAAAKESGKSVGSLLLSSITGIGGLGLAVAAVTSGLLIYQNGIVGFSKKTKEAKDEAEKLAELLKSVKSAAETTFEGIGASQGDIIQVRALAAAVGDETRSQIERGRALEKLKSINKEYFGDLKLEEDSLRTLTPLVNEYTNALIQQAIVRELQTEIGKIGATFIKQAKAVSDAKDALNKYKESLNIPAVDKAGNRVFVLDSNIDALNANLKKAQDTLAPTAAKFNELSNALNDATLASLKYKLTTATSGKKEEDTLGKQLSLLEKIRDAQKELQGKFFDLKELDEATDKLAKLESQVGDLKLQIAVRDAKKAGLPPAEIEKLKEAIKQDTQKRLNEAFEKEALLLEFSTKLKFSPVIRAELPTDIESKIAKATGFDKKIPISTEFEIDVKFFGLKTAQLRQALREINKSLKDQIRDIFSSGLSDVFAGLGEGLGESFAEAFSSGDFGGGLRKAAQNIVSIVGGVMQQLGKALITAAIKIKLLKDTFEKWAIANPALAIVAGIGLVAAGAALKNMKFEGPKFATGGIVSGPIIGQIGEMHRPEVIMPLDRLPQMLRSIGGGGGNDMQLIPIINNEGLYLAVQRGARRAGRKF